MTKHQLATESATFTKAWELASANPVVALAVATAVAVILVTASPVFQGLKKFPSKKTTLQKDKVVALKLKKKIIVSHDTRIFQFALPSEEHVLGLPIGQHVMVSIAGTNVQRSYTPISSDDDKGIVELMIKVYKAGVHPKFPEGGKMSQHMDSLREGIDTMNFRGPTGRFEYKGRGHCFAKRDRHIKRMAMIGGGTGITPLLQVIRAVLKDPEDQTEIALIFANRNEQDILLREELEVCAKDPRFKVWFTLSNPPQTWNYGSGHITEDMIKEHLFPASDDTLVLMCGPPPMITHACKPNLEKAGYTAEHYVVF